MPQLSAYKSDLDYAYAPGAFPAMECLLHRPECARRVLLHSKAEGTEGAQKLAERSSQDISVADVYRETYRARRRRKKKDAMTAAPYSTSTLVPRAQLPVTPAPSDDSLAARLKQRETKPLEFNPKPDADDLI